MVIIVDFSKRQNSEGKEFMALILQGGLELVKSQKTDRYYATAKKASLPSKFTEETCKTLIVQQLPGAIMKVECDPYEFTIPETGESNPLSAHGLHTGWLLIQKYISPLRGSGI